MCSRLAIAAETDGWAMESRRAAFAMLPESTTVVRM